MFPCLLIPVFHKQNLICLNQKYQNTLDIQLEYTLSMEYILFIETQAQRYLFKWLCFKCFPFFGYHNWLSKAALASRADSSCRWPTSPWNVHTQREEPKFYLILIKYYFQGFIQKFKISQYFLRWLDVTINNKGHFHVVANIQHCSWQVFCTPHRRSMRQMLHKHPTTRTALSPKWSLRSQLIFLPY